ncbi:LysR family transcriptional regulator [Saccharomonospora saliphila]|uniref:LysR family transcriptional regulator n=1 Tax=Saccharomonospora saliphila TaxID=369829 RepID=UPI000381DE32|nr:LysR family transcriptional regulator [Saccharomonospora saliphila]
MERKQVEYFLAVAAHGSFTSAANSLRVSQPSLSYGIRALEKELGATLFRRLGRGVVLTSTGEALLAPAREVIRDFSKLQTEARRVTELMSGRLDIVAVTTLAIDPLAAFVGEFRNRYPGVELSISDPENAAAVVDLVRRGHRELGLTERNIAADGVETFHLPEQEVFAVLPPGTELSDSVPVSVRELATLDIVTTPPGTTSRSFVDEVVPSIGATLRIAVEVTHRAAIVPLVLAGAGATLLPGRLARDAAALGAVIAPLDPPVTRHGVLVFPPGPLSPAAQAFVDLVVRRCAPDDAASGDPARS